MGAESECAMLAQIGCEELNPLYLWSDDLKKEFDLWVKGNNVKKDNHQEEDMLFK